MASEWQERPLGELTENFDAIRVPVKEADRRVGPYPYYGASGIVDYVDSYLFDGEYLLIAEDGENLRTRNTPVAFLVRGKFWVNNHAHIVRANSEADTRFLMYALAATEISGYLTGSTMPKLTQGNMNRIPILAPPVSDQRAIAHILGTLDDKIELKRRMNETLESMAHAIFKSWFVDFDPILAKADGRQPSGMDAKTAALFPASFSDSPLGKIPNGFEVTELGSVLGELETGSRPKGGVGGYSEGIPSIGAESIVGLAKFDLAKTKYVPHDYYLQMKKGKIKSRDVLLYKDGGRPGEYEPHAALFGDGFPFEQACINEHVYRLRGCEPLSQAFLYFSLTSDSTMDEMRQKGTGVAIPGLNSTAVRSLAILIPPKSLLLRFEETVEPMIRLILNNSKESFALAAIRDMLLPKLISGEVRVKNTKNLAERTV